MDNTLLIGWYDPGSKRFCYDDVKKVQQKKDYTVPVYAHIDDDVEKLKQRIKELERLRGGVRVSLIAARSAVIKGGEVTEEMLTELIDELEVKPYEYPERR